MMLEENIAKHGKICPWLKCASDNQSGYGVMCKVSVISKLSNISAHKKH